MADLMTFPNTVEEFMDQYKITDTEQIYTNGAELVPIFRMEQWFEHADFVPVVRCKDCKFRGHIQRCPFGRRAMPHANGYCCYGERRDDDDNTL